MTRALVFDSGVGGLTIAQAIRAAAPDWTVDYAADAAFFPYGTKSDEDLRARLPGLIAALVERARPDLVVIACNTASTLALAEIRAVVSVPVVGAVPAIRPAALMTKTGVIGVLATPGTVRRAYLDDLIRDFAADKTVIRRGSSALVTMAEQVVSGIAVDPAAIADEVRPIFDGPLGARIDVVVLACTHFPLIRAEIQAACPPDVQLVDTGEAVARQALRVAPMTEREASAPVAWVTGGAAKSAGLSSALGQFGYKIVTPVDL